MTSLFSKPDAPALPPPPPAPTPDNNRAELNAVREQERQKALRGASSQILTSPQGLTTDPVTSSRVLLGA